ncbi:MAG: putative porin [Terriglobales bacterium]
MRPYQPLRLAAIFAVLTATVFAQTGTAPNPTPKPRKKAAPAATLTAEDVKSLRDALASQQREIQELRDEVRSRDAVAQQAQQQAQQAQQQLQQTQSTVADAQQKAAAAETIANEQKDSVNKLNTDLADVKLSLQGTSTTVQEEQRRTSALEALAGRFRFVGDVRLRGESFFQPTQADRNRALLRVRFGVEGQLNEDFIAGIALATGPLGNPTTANEGLTGNFDRKTIGLDKGYITFNPVEHRWLSLTGGKFAYLWQRTSVTGDPDLNPEGFDEKLSFDVHSGPIQNVTIQGMELLYNESTKSTDSYAIGMQASARLKFGPWTTTPSFLSLKWDGPDALLSSSAFTVGETTTGYLPSGSTKPVTGIPVPGEGQGCASALGAPAFAPCIFAPNGMTNATYIDSKGVPHFYSGYNYADFILNNQIQTGIARLPFNLVLELEDNLDAEAHPLNTKGAVLTNLGSQNKEYGVDASLGQLKKKNDFQFGYAWLRQEQDSVLASFAESDQRAPTNILQNRVYALWKLRVNTVAGFTWWHGRTLDSDLENNAASAAKTITKAGETEPYLNRYQFDLIYTF